MIAGLGMWWLVGSGQSSYVLPKTVSPSAHNAAASSDTATGISIIVPDAVTLKEVLPCAFTVADCGCDAMVGGNGVSGISADSWAYNCTTSKSERARS